MRLTFQEELDRLEADLQEESQLVIRSLRGAMTALRSQDVELADEDRVRRRGTPATSRSSRGSGLLPRQTPVASDLRLVLAILHVNLHLERMADLCVTIAKLMKLVVGTREGWTPTAAREAWTEMGERAEEMIRARRWPLSAERDLGGAESRSSSSTS